jgi:hypothetical protein
MLIKTQRIVNLRIRFCHKYLQILKENDRKFVFFLHYGKVEFYRLHRDEKVGVSTVSLAKKKTQMARQ